MNDKYSDEIRDLLNRTYPKLATAYRLEFKSSFGAVAGYVDGNIFVSCAFGQIPISSRIIGVRKFVHG